MRSFLIIIFSWFLVGISPAYAETHALIVGINSYSGYRPLLGAVNDARDLEKVLRRIVGGTFVVLIEEDATRANFLSAWQRIQDNAKPGDTVVITFAGHGAQIADDDEDRDEADGSDEVLLFQPFDEINNFGEKLVDDEIFELFNEAEQNKLKLLFIMDACFSGGLVRSIARDDIAASSLPTRFTRFKTKPTRSPVPPDFQPKPVKLARNATFVSATHERLKIQEVLIAGKPRGALSYVFARGLEGHADSNRDGTITVAELERYVKPNVREIADNRQIPEFLTGDPKTRLIAVVPTATSGSFVKLPDVALAVKGSAQPDLPGAALVNDISDSDIVWDEQSSELVNRSGDILASNITENNLGSAIDAQRLRKVLLKLREQGNVMALDLLPDDRLYREANQVIFRSENFRHPHITVFNVHSDGTFQFLYPLARYNDPVRWPEGKPWEVDTKVQSPFGADILVIISSEKPLVNLHRKFLSFHCRKVAKEAYLALAEELPSTEYEIGLKTVFTQKKETDNAPASCT